MRQSSVLRCPRPRLWPSSRARLQLSAARKRSDRALRAGLHLRQPQSLSPRSAWARRRAAQCTAQPSRRRSCGSARQVRIRMAHRRRSLVLPLPLALPEMTIRTSTDVGARVYRHPQCMRTAGGAGTACLHAVVCVVLCVRSQSVCIKKMHFRKKTLESVNSVLARLYLSFCLNVGSLYFIYAGRRAPHCITGARRPRVSRVSHLAPRPPDLRGAFFFGRSRSGICGGDWSVQGEGSRGPARRGETW